MPRKKKEKPNYSPYRNRFEYDVGNRLRGEDVDFSYETEKLTYTLTKKYIPDFVIRTPGGIRYIETKGNGRSFDAAARAKMIAVKKQHPDKDIRILFWSNGEFGARRKDGSRQTQMGWAKKNGFIAAVREIPDEWYK